MSTLWMGGEEIGAVTDVTFSPPPSLSFRPMPMKISGTVTATFVSPDLHHFVWKNMPGGMRAAQTLQAARVPETLAPQSFGLWTIQRVYQPDNVLRFLLGGPYQTVLRRVTMATIHLPVSGQEIVMEDSLTELRKHLPIWMVARGRVLVTGLGLGCVVRGLLINPLVEHIDVIELDPSILRIVGAEFLDNPRVTLHFGDALKYRWRHGTRWDFAWHDIWSDEPAGHRPLQILHAHLFSIYQRRTGRQGAWNFPRDIRQALKRGKNGAHFL